MANSFNRKSEKNKSAAATAWKQYEMSSGNTSLPGGAVTSVPVGVF